MVKLGIFAGLVVALAGAASAQTLTNREAGRQLFNTRGVSVELIKDPDLTDQEMGFVQEVAKQQIFYAAVAYSPGDGLVANATVAAVDFHSIPSAEAAALAACTERQENTSRSCAIVARVRPSNYEPRALEMSRGATEGYRSSYRRARGS